MTEWTDKLRILLGERRHAYRQTFKGPLGEAVLKDLMRFCRMHESTFHDNERVQSKLDGRREVILRISHHLNLTPEALWRLYHGAGDD